MKTSEKIEILENLLKFYQKDTYFKSYKCYGFCQALTFYINCPNKCKTMLNELRKDYKPSPYWYSADISTGYSERLLNINRTIHRLKNPNLFQKIINFLKNE